MDHLRRLGGRIAIPIRPDEAGFLGRECPQPSCEGYFKIQVGTGLKGEGLPCHCPYCGHTAGHDHFWTKEQIEYAKSVATRKITDVVYRDLKSMEFEHKSRGPFGIGISLTVKSGRPIPIRYYREKKLETEVVCTNCTLRYSVYGVFAFCPDCGQHNSLQIVQKNLELVGKVLDLAATAQGEIAENLIENALEDCVSAFDGFGRELCRVHKDRAADPTRVERISFQNLEAARQSISGLFSVDLAAQLTPDVWQFAVVGFQKRHLIAHKMGIVDQEYITKTGDTGAVIGRKVSVGAGEVTDLIQVVSRLAGGLSQHLTKVGNKA
jgi:hypothetical protein